MKTAIFLSCLLFISFSAQAYKITNPNGEDELNDQQRLTLAQNYVDNQQWEQAFELLENMAKEGNLIAQTHLGIFYNIGHGTAINKEKALWWFNEAADQGSIRAINNLGLMYLTGDGVKKDEAHAIKLFEKTAQAKDQDAILMLGEIYFRQQNYLQALKWFRKAANLGNLEGKYRLGLMYEQGQGTKIDKRKASQLYQEILQSDFDLNLKKQIEQRLNSLKQN